MYSQFDIIELVAKIHDGQYRKHEVNGNKLPYIFHCFDVARRLWNWGIAEPKIQAAALLHDALEETLDLDYTKHCIAQVTQASGVLTLVEELTHFITQDKAEYIKSFANKSVEALVIKIADRLCNVEDFNQFDPSYAYKYLCKAEALFDVWDKRSTEIDIRFGEGFYKKIDAEILCVFKKVSGYRVGRRQEYTSTTK